MHFGEHVVPGTCWQLYPGLQSLSMRQPSIQSSVVPVGGVGDVVGAVNGLMHVTLHRVPGTNWQTAPGLSQHFILVPQFKLTVGHISSGGVLMHLKEHWVNGINWQLSPILYPQSKQLLVQISGVLLLHLKEHRVPGINWQVWPGLYPQSIQSLVQTSGVVIAGVVVTVVVEGVDGGAGSSKVHFLK